MRHRLRGLAVAQPLGYPGVYRDDSREEWAEGKGPWSPAERSYRKKGTFQQKG